MLKINNLYSQDDENCELSTDKKKTSVSCKIYNNWNGLRIKEYKKISGWKSLIVKKSTTEISQR
jgi:hypothetical protein